MRMLKHFRCDGKLRDFILVYSECAYAHIKSNTNIHIHTQIYKYTHWAWEQARKAPTRMCSSCVIIGVRTQTKYIVVLLWFSPQKDPHSMRSFTWSKSSTTILPYKWAKQPCVSQCSPKFIFSITIRERECCMYFTQQNIEYWHFELLINFNGNGSIRCQWHDKTTSNEIHDCT